MTCGYHSSSLLNVESISPLMISFIKSNKLFSESRSHRRGKKRNLKRVIYQINNMHSICMTQRNDVDKCNDHNILALCNQDMEELKLARQLRKKKTQNCFPVTTNKSEVTLTTIISSN
jgi:hypothetical protein